MQATDLLRKTGIRPEVHNGDNVQNDPVNLVDPDGLVPIGPIALGVWALVEAGLSAWDAVSTVQTVLDPCESTSNKVLSVELFALGMVSPGGGGSTALRYSDDAAAWLGKGAKVIKNDAGDTVFLSKDGLRRLRFDINRPYPHQNPHGHVEELIHGKWKKSGPIYPKDVPHE